MINIDIFKSISDIERYRAETGASDGEDSYLELKGLNSGITISKTDKKNFAKELCAFSNTYGGILCVHKGNGNNLVAFQSSEIGTIFQSLETWTRNAIEPPLPMALNIVEGVILIEVKNSLTKPHRSCNDSKYYYRHNSQSESMPEVMIRAMYNSGAHLEISTVLKLGVSADKKGFYLYISLENLSGLCGTKGRIKLIIISDSKDISRLSSKYFPSVGQPGDDGFYTGFQTSSILSEIKKAGASFHMKATNKIFENEVLYPKEKLTFTLRTPFVNEKGYQEISLPTWFILEVGINYLERPRVSKMLFFVRKNADTYSTRELKLNELLTTVQSLSA